MTYSYPLTPVPFLLEWLSSAKQTEPSDPDAACLSTVDEQGFPNSRMVLVRIIDDRGLCFFTNCESQKGQELKSTSKAALNFYWKTCHRQVRIRGHVVPVDPGEADAYFSARPLGHKISAWASEQSRPLGNRKILIDRMEEAKQKFGDNPPRPPHWSGYRIIPVSIEFWQEGELRLHHRTRYDLVDGMWAISTLYP